MNKRCVGSAYEQKAAEYLQKAGYQILEANYRCRLGEIDLIALHGKYLVFIEVKYRKSRGKGNPLEAVHRKKQLIIGKVAEYYLLTHPKCRKYPCRFDVVGILGEEITLVQNAFEL